MINNQVYPISTKRALQIIITFLIFPFQKNRNDTEATDAAGEEPKEDVGRGNQPEGEDVDNGVAVLLRARQLRACLGPVYTIHPDATLTA